jgi:hypothetical protein
MDLRFLASSYSHTDSLFSPHPLDPIRTVRSIPGGRVIQQQSEDGHVSETAIKAAAAFNFRSRRLVKREAHLIAVW